MGDRKFKAFISYSHADEAWGGWLQRSLEQFRAPTALADELMRAGASPRLAPIFRDREDLPVAGSLNSAIQAALADSEYQIVLCSPNSAKSKWVNEEIKLFHRLHGPGRVFALIISGEPNAANIPGREAEECFPPALRVQLTANGDETDDAAEPLAADARRQGDGKRYAFLKIAAGMLGVGLDDLVRREAQRRARQAWIITAASLTGATAAAALAFYAVAKSDEATIMRNKAEELIEFMLTDLNKKLEPVGRLDVLESVVDRAMDYYADQDLNSLDDDALARRAKAMMQLGTIDYRRNNFNEAQHAYEAAQTATAELLRRSPNSPDRIFDHAQNVFYVGEAALSGQDLKKREAQFTEYLRLAEKLMELDGANPRSQLELAYATSNIGILYFNQGDFSGAIPHFHKSIEARKKLLDDAPDDASIRRAYAYAISWEAYAELQRGNYKDAISLFLKQLDAYGALAKIETEDFTALDAVVTAQRRLAEAYLLSGEIEKSSAINAAAETTADALIERDPHNSNWSINAAHIQRAKSYYLFNSGDAAGAEAAAQRSIDLIEAVLTDDAPHWYSTTLGQSLAWRIEILGERASESDVERLKQLIDRATQSDIAANARFVAGASITLAQRERRRGDDSAAIRIMNQSLSALEPTLDQNSASSKIYVAAAYLEAGAPQKAAPIIAELEALGTKSPEFEALERRYASLPAK